MRHIKNPCHLNDTDLQGEGQQQINVCYRIHPHQGVWSVGRSDLVFIRPKSNALIQSESAIALIQFYPPPPHHHHPLHKSLLLQYDTVLPPPPSQVILLFQNKLYRNINVLGWIAHLFVKMDKWIKCRKMFWVAKFGIKFWSSAPRKPYSAWSDVSRQMYWTISDGGFVDTIIEPAPLRCWLTQLSKYVRRR